MRIILTDKIICTLTILIIIGFSVCSCKSDPDITDPNTNNGQDNNDPEPPELIEKTFTFNNPSTFSYPYFDGSTERMITELRDPCIIREGDTYYLVYTHYPFTHHTSKDESKPDMNSSPGIRLYSSKDLKNWTFEKWLVKSSELVVNCPYKHRFWAPEIHKIKNKFYLIFYADNWIKEAYNPDGQMGTKAFVGVSNNITGPYEHITYLEGAGCDTNLFEDENGKTYAIMPFGEMYIQEVDLRYRRQ